MIEISLKHCQKCDLRGFKKVKGKVFIYGVYVLLVIVSNHIKDYVVIKEVI